MSVKAIGLETTNRCNYACIHCLRADIAPRKHLPQELQDAIGPKNARLDIPLALVDKIIDEAAPLKIPQVAFTGGEPTIHPQFDEIVRKFCEAGYQFGMVTNGTNFAKIYKLVSQYRDNFYGFCFSMDGATARTMDEIRQKNSFTTSLQAISVCRAKGLPFAIQMVITGTNRHEMADMAILASKVGAQQLFLVPVQPTLQTTYGNMNLAPQDWYDIQREIGELQRTFKVSIEPFVGFPEPDELWTQCNALTRRALYIDYVGNMTFCCQLSEYADSQVRTDIVANLQEEHLLDAYTKYQAMINTYLKVKKERFEKNQLTKLDAFPCWYCSKYFDKVGFMKRFQNDPWYEPSMFDAAMPKPCCVGANGEGANGNGVASKKHATVD